LICQWINLIFCLKKFALAHDVQTIKARIEKLNSTSAYDLFVRDVFGTCTAYLDCGNLQKDMELAVSLIKKTVLTTNPLEERLGKINHRKAYWYLSFTEKKPEKINMAMEFIRQAPPRRARVAQAPPRGAPRREAGLFGGVPAERLEQAAQRLADEQRVRVQIEPMNFNIPVDVYLNQLNLDEDD
jgi:hypothetical protein